MFKLAHITDPHFQGFTGSRLGDYLGKRAIGALNLLLVRRRRHQMHLLAAMGRDLRERAVDHLALTGDLSNVSLPGEWQAARRWLDEFAPRPEAATVIPGNHDTYVPAVVAAGVFEQIFAPFQTAELRGDEHVYPFVRLRGDVALVAVNTCVPTGDLGAWGLVGEAQRARLEKLLLAPEVARRVRVVLLHHPPVVHRPPESRNLRDREQVWAILRRTGADLVLHGHDHRDQNATLEGPGGARIPVVGVGSASYAGHADHRSRYNVYEIEGRHIEAVTYAHDEGTDRFREAKRQLLSAS
jgi:3',5'-cyclic AMP phosphodiesterase CpdA